LDQARFDLIAEVVVNPDSAAAEARLTAASDELLALIHKKVQPVPHRFELRKVN
jgi:hypothetical protein